MSLNAVQGHLRASIAGRAHRVGPFLITFEPDIATPGRNYAIPDDGATPDAADVAELVAYFATLDRTPRLEYVGPAVGPAVGPTVRPAFGPAVAGETALDSVLLAAGFVVENRYPLMIINPGGPVEPPLPAGLEILLATTDDQLWQVARVQNSAYGEGPPTEHDVARLRRTVRGGGAVALALLGDVPVGAGLFTAPSGDLTEIAAVGVVEEYRRRGIATAVGYRLTRAALDAGAVPYLQAEGEAEQRIYARLGYRTIGALTAISQPAGTIMSERLVLRPLTPAEAARIIAGDISRTTDGTTAGWTAGDGWPHDDTRDGLALIAAGALGWLVTLDGVVIGDCGTTGPVSADGTAEGTVEIGYGLAKPYRGRGYGGETVRALSHWLLRQPGVREVVATTDTGNTPSQRALRRAGFRDQPAGEDDQQIRYVLSELPVDEGPPKIIGAERETLLAFIGYLRGRLAAKLAGLSETDARRPGVPSGTNLLWLVKHAAAVEVFWLHHVFAGADRNEVLFDDALTDADTVASVLARLDPIGSRTTAIVRDCADLDTLATHPPHRPPTPSLRWILVHLVEEFGRHAGHADILREQMDGAVGR